MCDKKLAKKLAKVEFLYDQLLSNIDDLNRLLEQLGFPKGIISLREAAQEIQNPASYDD